MTATPPADEPAGLPSEPIDVRRLRESLAEIGVPAVFKELVGVFLQETPERIVTLRRAAAAGDRRTVKFVAHTLKGTCGYLGARGLARICQELEGVSAGGAMTGGLPLLDELEAEFGRVRAALQHELGESAR